MYAEFTKILDAREGFARVWHREDVSLDTILHALGAPGHSLKVSPKSETRRVGAYVVKSSRGPFLVQLVRHTAQRDRYRNGWRAALHLEENGVSCAHAVAHIEWCFAGFAWKHATLYEHLDECVDVEHFVDRIIAATLSHDAVRQYLDRLAAAVNSLAESGAIHTDLAGKNILTRDGHSFYFIDLDGILLGERYSADWRLKNHVQLYDSFIDRCADETLAPFIAAMLPDNQPLEPWLAKVRTAQAGRRARTVAAWKREGKLP